MLGVDAADLVSGAGGLVCDAVRAGLQVDVYLETVGDEQPLQILGVRPQNLPARFDFDADRPDAIYCAAALQERHRAARRLIADVTRRRRGDLALWGGTRPNDLAAGADTEHRLSAAAQAFKLYALKAVGITVQMAPTESFRGGCHPQ